MMGKDGNVTKLATLSRNEFRDDIPAFLEGYYKSLNNEDVTLEGIGRKHGAERWEYGLDLQQTMKDWNVLHQVLMEEINKAHRKLSLSTEDLKEAQRRLAIHIHEGILYSVKEFNQLQNSETEAQLLDLKEALKEPEGLSREHNLRRTSHDLKGIMKNLQMGFFLLEDEKLDGRSSELIDQMSSASDSLEQLLNDLLDLFRLETHREEVDLSTFDVAEVLRELTESMKPMAETEKLDLIYGGDQMLMVKSDSKKIQRVARNLILNALKYTQDGHVEVTWKSLSSQQWVLEVSDTGPGLSATHAKSLTDESDSSDTVDYDQSPSGDGEVSSKVKSHGEGIGLLIVRHLCKLLDAIIKVKTSPGSGTTFQIVFPKQLTVD